MKNKTSLVTSLFVAALTALGFGPSKAAIHSYTLTLDGPTAGTASLGTGFGSVNYDDVGHLLQLEVSFSGLTGTTTASHIHVSATPFTQPGGVATTTPSFAGFPLGVTSGSFSNTLDLTVASSWNNAFVTANGGTLASAETALFAAFESNRAYWNIHSSVNTGGEINGFITVVPEPSSLSLLALSLGGLAARAWARRRSQFS